MKLLGTDVTGVSEDTNRITGYIKYDDGSEDEYWFEYPAGYDISESGNPWLVIMLPMAATIGEDIHISLPLDQRLVEGSEDILRIWKSWETGTSIISIHAEGGFATIEDQPTESAVFFSSGVDAFYTAYKRPRAKYKILIHGMDINIDKKDEFEAHQERISKVTDELGGVFIPVASNIRKTKWSATRWQAVSHGSLLASISLLFERYFHEAFIASSHNDYAHLSPGGSHPLSDPLFSTSRTNIIHNADGVSRFEKIKYLAQHNLALRHMHVCIRGRDGKGQDEINCSHCEKCYRTMIALDLVGALDKTEQFDLSRYNYSEVQNVFLNTPHYTDDYIKMAKLAQSQGKTELANGIRKCMRRSALLRFLYPTERIPFVWRIFYKMYNNSIS